MGASTAYGEGYGSLPSNYTSVGGAASAPLVYGHVLAEGASGLSPAELGAAATTYRGSEGQPDLTPRERLMGKAKDHWNKLKSSKLGQTAQARYEEAKKVSWKDRGKSAQEALKRRMDGLFKQAPDYRAQTAMSPAAVTSTLPAASGYGNLTAVAGTTGYGQAAAAPMSHYMTDTTAPSAFWIPRGMGQGAVPSVAQPT